MCLCGGHEYYTCLYRYENFIFQVPVPTCLSLTSMVKFVNLEIYLQNRFCCRVVWDQRKAMDSQIKSTAICPYKYYIYLSMFYSILLSEILSFPPFILNFQLKSRGRKQNLVCLNQSTETTLMISNITICSSKKMQKIWLKLTSIFRDIQPPVNEI